LAGEDFVQVSAEAVPVGPYTVAANTAFAALPLFQEASAKICAV